MIRRGLAIVLAGLVVTLTGCPQGGTLPVKLPSFKKLGDSAALKKTTDEEQIVLVLDDVQRGMQSKQIFKVLSHVSRTYRDGEGRDYAALEAYLAGVFKNYRTIRITRVVPRIVVQENRARAVETFGTSAEPQDPGAEPPINLQGQVTVNLEKTGGEWQIVEWGGLL